jgi:hypothetical protein
LSLEENTVYKFSFWKAVLLASVLAAAGCNSAATEETAAGENGDEGTSSRGSLGASPGTSPVARVPASVTIAEGTEVKIRLNSTLSTQTAQAGQAFDGVLMEPLMAGNTVVAAQGAPVTGVVADSDEGGRVKGLAQISLRLAGVELVDGRVADISTNTIGREARNTKKKDAITVGVASGVGAAIGAIAGGGRGAAIGAGAGAAGGSGVVLATRGVPATFPAETPLTFTLQAPLSMTVNSRSRVGLSRDSPSGDSTSGCVFGFHRQTETQAVQQRAKAPQARIPAFGEHLVETLPVEFALGGDLGQSASLCDVPES